MIAMKPEDKSQLTLNEQQIQSVKEFKYLGAYTNSELGTD